MAAALDTVEIVTTTDCEPRGTFYRLDLVNPSKFGWIAVLLAIPVLAQPSWEQKALADIAEALKKTGAPSVSVVIIEDGKIALSKAFGKADLASNRAAEPGTRYAVGSISKQFTVAALLLLQEEGKLSLDDKVAR